MNVFIIGISGGIGTRLARRLRSRGDIVRGLVRREVQRTEFQAAGVDVVVGDLASLTLDDLARAFGPSDAVVFAAGSNGGDREVTKAIDGEGIAKALTAASLAGVDRFISVSVLPESWRERDLGEEVEYYFSVKKEADIAVSRSDLDWVILRPSLLVSGPGRGTVSLGAAEAHGEIARDDVAQTLTELLMETRISRRILEVDGGVVPIAEAVRSQY